jgi:hypothetical protein
VDDGVEGHRDIFPFEPFQRPNVRFGRDGDPVAAIREACDLEGETALVREDDGEHIGHRAVDLPRLQGRVALDRARKAHEADRNSLALKQPFIRRHDERQRVGICEYPDAQGGGRLCRRLRPGLHKRRERDQENRKYFHGNYGSS